LFTLPTGYSVTISQSNPNRFDEPVGGTVYQKISARTAATMKKISLGAVEKSVCGLRWEDDGSNDLAKGL
jgi:hypothetical protein